MQSANTQQQQIEALASARRRNQQLLECVMRIHAKAWEASQAGAKLESQPILADIEATILTGTPT